MIKFYMIDHGQKLRSKCQRLVFGKKSGKTPSFGANLTRNNKKSLGAGGDYLNAN